MWATNPNAEIAVSVALNGFTVTGTAQLFGYSFNFGDGEEVQAATGGGDAQPGTTVYETKGDYDVHVAALSGRDSS